MSAKSNQKLNYWWVVASENNLLKQWHWQSFFGVANKPGKVYDWGGPDWIESRVSFARIREMRKGDIVVAYQANEGVVGLALLASNGYPYVQGGNYDAFDLESTPKVWLDYPIPYSEIRKLPGAKDNIEFVRFHQGTVFRVDENAYKLITRAILKTNSHLRKQLSPFLVSGQPTVEAEVRAVDDEDELKKNRKVTSSFQRVIRDSKIGKTLKRLYQYKCQVCGETIETSDSKLYAEVHHLQPVGKPHYGKDGKPNAVVVCPQHHAMFDLGVIAIHPDTLKIEHWNPNAQEHGSGLVLKHKLDKGCLRYHYEKIFRAQ